MAEQGSSEVRIKAKFQSKSRFSAVYHEALLYYMLVAMSSLEDTLFSLIKQSKVLIN